MCLGVLCLSAAWGQEYTISTIAGSGTPAFTGDNGPAAAAQFNSPGAVLLDSAGNIYISDTGNHCIRKISGGTITTIAGTGGTIGDSGDKGAATSALLNAPTGLAFDSKGNLYIADSGNHVIRKITGTTITTVAGDYGLGGGYSGDLGPAISAGLNNPTAVALDSKDNLYIAGTNSATWFAGWTRPAEHHHVLRGCFRRQHGHFRKAGGTPTGSGSTRTTFSICPIPAITELQRSRHHWRSATSRAT